MLMSVPQDAHVSETAVMARTTAGSGPRSQKGSKGQTTEHALMKLLREHDVLCDKLAVP